ncbi:MAG TPA: ABC transporter ATP-binding protein [Candidatus Saccharimonadales bacterium]|nr:ABC transporter ATP-binding protein [Candidatus Saccharimonadales bacterium]
MKTNPEGLDIIIHIAKVSRRFGTKLALKNVDLQVERGKVFGLVGENGAGKTTLIKHMLGLLRAETGSVRVFGMDPVQNPPEVLSRIGFLSENRDLPAWMRVDELLHYTSAFYPKWDRAYAESLREQFGLNPEARIKSLSRGETAKAGLLVALAYRPELLLLDEPSSGLDPLVRRDILEAIIRTVADEGRTVFFSSHLLEEIERVSDDIALMRDGQVVLSGPLDQVKAQHYRITFRLQQASTQPPRVSGALSMEGSGREWTAICNGAREQLIESVGRLGGQIMEEETPSLNEIFVARASCAPCETA